MEYTTVLYMLVSTFLFMAVSVPSQNGPYDCDFEVDFCSWIHDPEADDEWEREQGSTGLVTHTGPPTDHTTGTQDVHQEVWKHEGNAGPQWNYVQIAISETENYSVMIQSAGMIVNIGILAIDDIIVYEDGNCPPLDSCGFELDICGYILGTNGSFYWDMTKADEHIKGPGYDHTTSTSQGHYMYVAALGEPEGHRAWLITPQYPATSGDDVADLSVYIRYEDGTTLSIWNTMYDQGVFWHIGEAYFVSDKPYQIIFEVAIDETGDYDVAVDDIKLTDGHCVGIDGWYMFIESAPPSSTGDKARLVSEVFMPNQDFCFVFYYHMYSKFGDSPGILRVIAEYTDGTEDVVVWTMQGNHADRWHEGMVDMTSTKAFRIAIEGEIGSVLGGDLAIDDTEMHRFKCIDKPPMEPFTCFDDSATVDPEMICDWTPDCDDASDEINCGQCDFEFDTCNYTDYSRSDYSWKRWSGPTPTENTGPDHDHTKGGSEPDMGKLEVFFLQNKLETRIWVTSDNKGDNWLEANVPIGRIATDWQLFFSSDRSFGNEGDIAIDDITLSDCWFPEIEASCDEPREYTCTRGSCVTLDKLCDFTDDCGDASDESEEICDGFLMCDFELDLCEFRQDDSDSWDYIHQRGSSAVVHETGPSRDHTLNTAAGHYLMLDTKSSSTKTGDTARLLSPPFQYTTSSECKVMFHYHMYGYHCGTLNVYTRTSVGGAMTTIWSQSDEVGDFWVKAEVAISEVNNFEVVFEAVVGTGREGDIGLDDISFSPECTPSAEDLPLEPPQQTTLAPCPEGFFYCNDVGNNCIPSSQKCDFKEHCVNGYDEQVCGTCDFEISQCGWNDVSSGMFEWLRLQVGESTSDRAPGSDGLGRSDGHFMLVEGLDTSLYIGAFLETDIVGRISRSCVVSFRYYMYGPDRGSLSFYLQDPDDTFNLALLWIQQGNQGTAWKSAEVFVGSHGAGWRFDIETYPLLGTITGEIVDMAVDEIEFNNCHPDDEPSNISDLTCDFEEGLCGWLQVASYTDDDDFDWARHSGPTETRATGPDYDVTKGSDGDGYYMYTEATNYYEDSKARLTIYPQAPTSEPSCLSFYYHMYGATVGSLSVYVQRLGFPESKVWTRIGTHGNDWHFAEKTISQEDNQYQIHIEGVIGNGYASDIAIDNITYNAGECPPTAGCNFEADFCDWENDDTAERNWRRGSDGTPSSGTGPEYDHTTGTADGWFAYIETSFPTVSGDEARLLSAVYPGGATECLAFWYHMNGRDIGILRIYTRDVGDGKVSELTWEKSTDQGNMWRYAHYKAYSDNDYQIVIEGVAGDDSKGDIAVDDLLPVDGPCSQPGYCSFDSGLCGWTNDRDEDDFDWQRNKGSTPTPDTGPSVDHTTASDQGHYMYTETNLPVGSGWKSQLVSEHFDPTQAESCFIFYYHMYGEG
ncbi:MAM and LDL-receptor class A domain-containing protein 1-like [Glandiceps talaboti]